jgi:hypothetical protein
MYQFQLIGRTSVFPGPKLPLRILMAIANRRAGERAFNIFTATVELLGKRYGMDRAQKVLSTSVWAPDWSEVEIEGYAAAFGQAGAIRREELRVADFPGTGLLVHPNPATLVQYPLYDIVHFAGSVRSEGPALNLHDGEGLMAGALRDALIAARTRLLIIQVRDRPENYGWESNVTQMAEQLVGGGGPPVLSVIAEEAAVVQNYFTGFYANLLHNDPLTDAAKPSANLDPFLKANLYYAPGAEWTLHFTPLVAETAQRLSDVAYTVKPSSEAVRNQYAAILHRADLARFDALLQSQRGPVLDPATLANKSSEVRNLNTFKWDHERDGVVPLSEAIDTLDAAEGDLQRERDLSAQIEAAAAAAPRVLNAAFANPDLAPSGAAPTPSGLLNPTTGLLNGAAYELWVDIGPRWDKLISLVKDNAVFPEAALPPSDEGHVLEVAVISEDFTPRSSISELWLPKGAGRSFPWVDGRRGEKPGPVKIPLKAPSFREAGDAGDSRLAYARISIYYRNNLLQSATVRATVVRNGNVPVEEPNTIEVDYVFSGSFQQIDTRYGARDVGLTPGEREGKQELALNITVNDNGAGGHRIVVKSAPGQPPAWMPFDPIAIEQELNDARTNLLRCFYKVNPKTGEVLVDREGRGIFGVDANNGKPREQFLWDVFRLAKFGNRLFNLAFGQANPEQTMLNSVWARELRKKLGERQVLQIARVDSLPMQYVFPWSLIYQYPLTGPDSALHWCKVIKEWSEEGIRTAEIDRYCKYEKDADHQENVLCPYGFWGLKHVIEQPLAGLRLSNGTYTLRDAPDKVLVPPTDRVGLAVGITRDTAINRSLLERHLERLAGLEAYQFSPHEPADDVDRVRAMLMAPSIVYFLCHGEFDANEKQPYLGVGLRDADPAHRIYLQSLQSWFSSTAAGGMDAETWQQRRPLVIINGCHTSDLAPGEILSFASAFGSAGASGVVGTEVAVVLQVAAEVAERLLPRLEGIGLGEALRQVRWELVNKGNLAGLAYTAYALADLHVTRMSEPAPFERTFAVAGAARG